MPILEAGLTYTRESKYIPLANDAAALINENTNSTPLYQNAANSDLPDVYLDLFNNASADIWATGLGDLYESLNYDGLWLDMNEVTALCNGNNSDMSSMCTGIIPNLTRPLKDEETYNTSWYTSYPMDEEEFSN